MTALSIVGAQLYSFSQCSNPDGTVNNDGKTFIFAFRDEMEKGLNGFAAQSDDAAAELSAVDSQPGCPNRNEMSGSGG